MTDIRKVGNYELLERIGQGGMGSVYKARQTSMDRIVALKILPPSLAKDPSFIERFTREARSSARLNHPNIVSAIDVGQAGGVYYYAMEFIPGWSVKALLEKGPMSEEKVLSVGYAMADALVHAHASGIIHRDIKPDNILIDTEGTPKLCDLGLARHESDSDEQKHLTQEGQTIGTPHYISPEQARGQRDLDGTTDLYSLGATLYHMLTGSTMFDGPTSVVVMSMHIADKARHPSEFGGKVSKGTVAILAKLLTKNRADRYESAEQLGGDLQRMMQGKPPLYAELPFSKFPFKTGATTLASAPVGPRKGASVAVRRPRPAAAQSGKIGVAAIVLLLLIGAGGYAFYLRTQSKSQMDAANLTAIAKVKPIPAKPVEPVKSATPDEIAVAQKKEKPVLPLEPNLDSPKTEHALVSNPGANPEIKSAPTAEIKPAQSDQDSKDEKKQGVAPAAVAVAETQIPEKPSEPAKVKEPVSVPVPETAPVVAKTEAGTEIQKRIDEALTLIKDSRMSEAAALFELSPAALDALDEFDRNQVRLHAAGLAGMNQTKNLIVDRITREPNKFDAQIALGNKWLGKLAGADEKTLKIADQGVEMQRRWQALSLQEFHALAEYVLGSVPVSCTLGLGLIAFDRKDDALAREWLRPVKAPDAVYVLDQIDARDKALAEKRAKEKNDAAKKLYGEMDAILAQGDLKGASAKATTLRTLFATTAIVLEKSADLDNVVESSKLAESAVVQPGNVALGTNGTTVKGPTSSPDDLIDGNTTKYDGGKGFAMGTFPCDWEITFPKLYMLREIRLMLWDGEAARFYRYSLELSMNGETFKMLADHSKGKWRSWQTIQFSPRPVKSIKIHGLHNSANGGFHVIELEAYCVPPDEPAHPKYKSEPAE